MVVVYADTHGAEPHELCITCLSSDDTPAGPEPVNRIKLVMTPAVAVELLAEEAGARREQGGWRVENVCIANRSGRHLRLGVSFGDSQLRVYA